MKSLTVIFALITVARGRPDVSHLPSGSYLPTGGQTDFLGGSNNIATNFVGNYGRENFGGSIEGGNFGGGINQVQDQKHVYFFAAPEEEQSSRLRINIVPSSQKNTKIIFIKSPSYGGVVPEVIAPPSLSEDKTLVYVLVKKSEQGGEINIPAGAGVKQAKPEVYFIKYKTQQDAQQQILGGLQGQPIGSNVPDLGNENSFVRTLDSGATGTAGVIGGSGQTVGVIGGSGQTVGTSSFQSGTQSIHGPAGLSGPY